VFIRQKINVTTKTSTRDVHITSTTQAALEGLALRIFAKPRQGIDVYTLMTSIDPGSVSGETVFGAYKAKVLVAAELIAKG
jgi:hypothetical protein